MTLVATVLTVLALVAGILLVWRAAGWPCPPWLVPLLENPYVEAVAGAETLLDRAGVRPGLRVLDAGCGPGRLTLPAAQRVGPTGRVLAIDIQRPMLEELERRLAERGVTNVEVVHAGLGEGRLPASEFDVALLVTVLGEIRDKPGALREIATSLRPGGVLSVTEVLPDPHYQALSRVRRQGAEAGFRETSCRRGWISYTLNLRKPDAG